MPTSSSSSSPSSQSGTMYGIPFTMTFWMPVSIRSSSSTQTSNQSQTQTSTTSQTINPFQAIIQAAMMSQIQQMQNTSTPPTPPPSPSNQDETPQQQTQTQTQGFSTQIPLPTLLNMLFSMGQGQGQGQPIDLTTFMQGGGNKPLPPTATHVINTLPKYQYQLSTSTSCAICQCDFEHHDEYTTLPCAHSYHTECITPWLKQHHTCPMCRYPLESDDAEFNREHVYQQQQTWKHVVPSTSTSSSSPVTTTTCTMSHHHHESCTILSGNTSTLTLSCGHSYHIECLDQAQRILHSSTTSHIYTTPQIVVCPHCQSRQSFPVPLADLLRVTTAATPASTPVPAPVPVPVSTAIIPTAASATVSSKDMDEIDMHMPDWATVVPPTSLPIPSSASVPVLLSSLNGSATIEEDTEMTDA